MSLSVDLLILIALVYASYMGTRRGMVLLALEVLSFFTASFLAILGYHALGSALKSWLHVMTGLSNVAAFITLWVVTELASALLIRFAVLPRIGRHVHLSKVNRAGGGLLGGFKSAAIITLALSVVQGLPVDSGIKQSLISPAIPSILLASSGNLPNYIADGLGRDVNESVSFFTVKVAAEDDKRIDLGYTTTTTSIAEKDETDMLNLLNAERKNRGIPILKLNIQARSVARLHSQDMFAKGYFSHINLSGKSPFDRMKAGGVNYDSAGENLALAPNMQQAHTGLMNSPGHKANILSLSYHTVGIGIINAGPYGVMVTQDFTD
jgi:uncharacterized protein YkwD